MLDELHLDFHSLIRPHVNSYASTVAAYLGWMLLKEEEFISLLQIRGGNDRIALAAETLREDGNQITFSFSRSIGPLVYGNGDHFVALASASQQLIGHCYEILREASLVPVSSSPVIEFFRHIRNGCFHGNRFNFVQGQPKNRAEWRKLTLTASLQDKKIFRDILQGKDFMLNFGDPLVLLHDVSEELKLKRSW